MKVFSNNTLIIPANINRKGVAYCVLNIDTGDYRVILKERLTQEQLNKIDPYRGTLLYIHKKYKVYGVIKDTKDGNKPSLNWLREQDFNEIKDEILNTDSDSHTIDISNETEDIFRGNYDKSLFKVTRRVRTRKFIQMSPDEFIDSITDKPIVQGGDSNIVVDSKEAVETKGNAENVEAPAEQSNVNDKEIINDAKNEAKEQYNFMEEGNKLIIKALMNATNTMANTSKELKEAARNYKKAMSKSYGELSTDVEEKIVGIDSIIDADETDSDADSNELYFVYDTILKLMKTNDSISVPIKYYQNLVNIIRRNIAVSRDGNKYDSIVEIKFESTNSDNILARVEYDSTSKYTRIIVIKPFNKIKVSDSSVIDYEIKFNQWRKHNSFKISD